MPSRAKNSAIVEVTDLPMTSQLNGWLEVRRTRFLFRLLSKIVVDFQYRLDTLNKKAVTVEHNVVSLQVSPH